MANILTFNATTFPVICRKLAKQDIHLKNIITEYGLPPMWTRPPTFKTLVLMILEQQVSLASAYAAFKKLKEKIRYITPERVLALTDEELRACYFSRQKIVYVRALADKLISRDISLKSLSNAGDEDIRKVLIEIKGIGHWTIDVYLMHALQRTDLFPLGDIALVNSLKHIKQLPKETSKEELLKIAEPWRPYRTIASMMLWHAYIKRKNIKLAE
jgi:DNA-3-methyladenine glycosylase II